jgi:hypothetical protein
MPRTTWPAVFFAHSSLSNIYLLECAKKLAGRVVFGLELTF